MSNKIKTKLLLISLRDPFLDNDRVMPPLGIMSLHSCVFQSGIDSTIENNFDVDNLEKYREFTHFGISCMTPQKKQAYAILHSVKKTFPKKTVIIGGPHATHYPDDCVKQPFDYVVTGDGEIALMSIVSGAQGLGQVLDMPVSQTEMNKMPLPYREPKFLNQYNFFVQGIRSTTVLTGKGCPMSCSFCEDAKTRVRLYTSENVGSQIVQAKEAGYKGIMFFDDIFTVSLKRVRELAEEIAKHNMVYRCFGHAKSMSEDMAKLLTGSGCIETGFGAESGSQKILDIVNKKTTVAQNYEYVETCNRHLIKVKAFIIVGLPGENWETIEETRRFLDFLTFKRFRNRFGKEVSNDFDVVIYFPYKGTQIRDSIDQNKNEFDLYFTSDPDSFNGFYKGKGGESETTIRTSALSGNDIKNIQKELLLKFKKKVLC